MPGARLFNCTLSAFAFALLFCCHLARGSSGALAAKQRSLDEWRALTAPTSAPPRVFVKGDSARFYFQTGTNALAFSAHWSRHRVPTKRGYRITSAVLQDRVAARGFWLAAAFGPGDLSRLPPDHPLHGWREATVIAGPDWQRLSTNLVAALTPVQDGHGIYYQGFFADRFWYRDLQGASHFSTMSDPHRGIVTDRRFSVDETLELLARVISEHLSLTHPSESLFLLMPPATNRFTQPLLLDQRLRQCVQLSPGALYDTTEEGLGLSATLQTAQVFLLEAHGLALIKNPVSSAARLVDFGAQTVVRFLQFPFTRKFGSARKAPDARSAGGDEPGLEQATDGQDARPPGGMDLNEWETWLDHYTGTRREEGSLELLLDGEHFFPRLSQAISQSTNHIYMDMYIFDRDDVAVDVADRLRQKSGQVNVRVIMDRMGSLGAGLTPPATPLPEDFVPPASISSYLKEDSHVRVRPFLNPWFSADHSKVILVDGARAWLGGMNIGREYRYEWHDLMVEVHGPVVSSLENEFRREWAHSGPFGDLGYLYTVLTPNPAHAPVRNKPATDATPPPHWSQLRLLPTKTGWKPFAAAILASFAKAKNYIYVENSYLFDQQVVKRLVEARARGVDVRVILPRVNDLKAGGRGNLVTANYLLQNGVRVYFYPGMTHVKALLVDDWACLGSANLNHHSLRLCQEHNIATSDPDFSARLKRELFEEDFAHSFELTEPISVDWKDVLADFVLENF